MAIVAADLDLIEVDGIGENACLVSVDPPTGAQFPDRKCANGGLSYFLEGGEVVIRVNPELLEGHGQSFHAHCAYSKDGGRQWDSDWFEHKLQQNGDDRSWSVRVPVDTAYKGLVFCVRSGENWLKEADNADCFISFVTRTQSFALDGNVLVAHSRGSQVQLQWVSADSSSCPHLVHYGVSYSSEGEWNSPSLDVEFKDGTADVDLPAKAVGVSFVLKRSDGTWLSRNSEGGNFYVSVRFCEEQEGEAFLEYPLRVESSVKRILDLRRLKPFWTYPKVVSSLGEVDEETQYMVVEFEDGKFCTFLAMVDVKRRARAGLRGWGGGLVVRVDAGDAGVEEGALVMAAAVSDALMTATRLTHQIATEMLRKQPRFEDDSADVYRLTRGIGWCSWDAFGTKVTADDVLGSVRALVDGGVPIRWVIIDDGWQDVDEASRELRSFGVAEQFGDMGKLIEQLKSEMGIEFVTVWHTIIGYWNGCAVQDVEVDKLRARFSSGLIALDANEMRQEWIKNYSIPRDARAFFDGYYAELQKMGVDGVKVDAQSILEAVGGRDRGRTEVFARYRSALEGAADRHFGGTVINCMSCVNDAVFCAEESPSAVVWRTSDDHAFHGREEDDKQVAFHIWSNAVNDLYLGEQFVPDWDMFRCSDRHTAVHAASRAVSGGPIYVSDGPNEGHRVDVLKKLVDSKGQALACPYAGKVCERSVFDNPLVSGRPFLVWNENALTAVVAVFNLSVDAPCSVPVAPRPEDAGVLKAKCKDASARYGAWSNRSGFLGLVGLGEPVAADELGSPLDFDVVTFAPVYSLPGGAEFCVFGLVDAYNGGATLTSVSTDDSRAEAGLRYTGRTGFWTSVAPKKCSLKSEPVDVVRSEDGFSIVDVADASVSLVLEF
mmetsp:Transcript_3381/g.10278  ORF Transcript_3381/g.10278 Transcript_3381/m.10278 type:complete len:887 (+) Transcript_3381:212-2872(+)